MQDFKTGNEKLAEVAHASINRPFTFREKFVTATVGVLALGGLSSAFYLIKQDMHTGDKISVALTCADLTGPEKYLPPLIVNSSKPAP